MEIIEARLEPFRPPLLLTEQPAKCADLVRLPLCSLLYFVLSDRKEDRENPRD